MIVVFSIALFTYVLFMTVGLIAWNRGLSRKTPSRRESLTVTIVIPVRNEQKNIGHLLKDLGAQHYDFPRMEVIVVDDHSTDDTSYIVGEWQKELPFSLKLVVSEVESTSSPKKRAIEQGIRIGMGEVIVTVDGDCRLGPHWLENVMTYFQQEKTHMVAGPVWLAPADAFFETLQQVEFASLQGVTGWALETGIPVMSNGANFAFRKSSFLAIDGFGEHSSQPSGDDAFLMHRFHQRWPGCVRYGMAQEAVVTTPPASGLKEFWNQRVRWSGKWTAYDHAWTKAMAVYIFLFHSVFVSGFIWLVFFPQDFYIILGALGIRLCLEFVFLNSVFLFFGKRMPFWAFTVTGLCYSFYAVLFGLAGTFSGFTWKGRNYAR